MLGVRRLAVCCPPLRRWVARAYSDQHVISSPFPDEYIPSSTLPEFVWRGLPIWQNKICMECAITGRSYTFAQARDGARRFAVSLQKMGLEPRDVVALVLPNVPEYPLVTLGAIEAGLVVTTVNPVYTAGEIAKQLEDSHAGCVVTDAVRFPVVRQALTQIGKPKLPVVVVASNNIPEGAVDFQQLIDISVDASTPLKASQSSNPDEVILLPYSSGTTGLPKGVMLSHRNIIANLIQVTTEGVNISRASTETWQDVVPGLLPFYHIYGLTVILLHKVSLGSKLVSLPKFEPNSFVQTIANHKPSLLFLAPPLLLFLAAHPAVTAELLAPVREIISGAAPVGASDIERLLAKCPPQLNIVQGYGMSETSPVIMMSRIGSKDRASVGPLVANTEAKVVDVDTGKSLGPGQSGEVCCRGPQVMLGYLNNQAATDAMIDKDGWLHTGDIGHYNDQHEFYITDRLKELIKVKGLQVAPAELEELLRSHPKVADVAVVAVPDERAGQVPRAVVVPSQPGAVSENELQAFVAERVSSHKHLAGGVAFVDSIPKSAAGKILRRQLVGV